MLGMYLWESIVTTFISKYVIYASGLENCRRTVVTKGLILNLV